MVIHSLIPLCVWFTLIFYSIPTGSNRYGYGGHHRGQGEGHRNGMTGGEGHWNGMAGGEGQWSSILGGQGYYYPNYNGGMQPNILPLFYGGEGYFDRINFEIQGCSRPVFTDEANFEIAGCKTNLRQDMTHYCHNTNLRIPYGTSGVMSCVRGRRLLRLTAKCEEDGTWKPAMVSSCNELFTLLAEVKGETAVTNAEPEYRKPSARHCAHVNIDQTPNFIIKCSYPPGQVRIAQVMTGSKNGNCMSQFPDGVPTGTRLTITCRAPSHSMQSEPYDVLCQDGRWEGKKVICIVPKKENPNVPVSKPIPIPVVIPTTAAPVINPTPTPPVGPPPVGPPPNANKPKTCAPLKARAGVELNCVWSGSEVGTNDCNTRLPVGTEARYECANYYETTAALPTMYRKCKEDGTWSGSSDFSCIVACGRDNVVKTAFITHSLPTLQGQWPWHAALFRNRSSDQETWEYICGGTLITKKALLTAGHCVTLLQTSKVVHTSDLQVHLGKYRREVNDEHVQIKQIADIIVNPSYNPYNYDSDVAIIIFKTDVTIGHFVRPICFLTTSDSALEDLQLSENSTGTVVGWGYDENNKLADDLRMAHLKVVGSRECAKTMLGSSITQLNTRSTTFCAGYANGTNVCNGDSGSGMYFPSRDTDNTRWYLQGLVSVGIALNNGRCNPEAFSVFTRLGRYADFITRTLSEHDAM